MCVQLVFLADYCCLGVMLELRPIVIIYNTVNLFEDHGIICAYNASKYLRFSLEIGPDLGHGLSDLVLPSKANERRYEFGGTLESTVRLRPGHKYVTCLLYDNLDQEVASATSRVMESTFDAGVARKWNNSCTDQLHTSASTLWDIYSEAMCVGKCTCSTFLDFRGQLLMVISIN